MPRVVYTSGFLTEANKTNISPQVVGMVELSNNAFAPGSVFGHTTYPLPAPFNYGGRLRDVSSLDFSLNGGVGRVTFSISNADLAEVPNVANDNYIGWECKVHKVLILDDGTITGILLLHGVVTSYTMTDQVVDMDVTTRINVTNSVNNRRVGNKCPWVFKGTECGYNGLLTTCNKLYSSADGCQGRDNQHRFGGFPERESIASIGVVSGQGPSPGYILAETFSEQVVTANTTVTATDLRYLKCDHTGPITITLPNPSTFPDNGQPITIKDCSTPGATTNNITVNAAGGGTVNGSTLVISRSNGAVTLSADKTGGDWRIVADYSSTGVVTSVAMTVPSILTVTGSPITSSGTLALSLATQSANLVFAGPTTGAAAAPTFRSLGFTDLPSIATDRLLGRVTASTGAIEAITPGTGVLTWIQTPSSANLFSALTTKTGTGGDAVFATNPTIDDPTILTGIVASTGFRMFSFAPVAGARNHTEFTTATSGNGPIMRAVGQSTNIPLNFSVKGNAIVSFTGNALRITGSSASAPGIFEAYGGTSQAGGIRLFEISTSGTGFVALQAPTLTNGTLLLTLPASDGTNGQVLSTDGAGNLSFISPGGSGTVTSVAMTVPSILTVTGSPITSSGTLAVTLEAQNANLVFAGPTVGGADTPSFRSLGFTDLPSISNGQIVGRTSSGAGAIEAITPGSGILTWLQTPSSANLAAAVTDETGTGKLVFSVNPELEVPYIDSIRAWVAPSTLGGRVLRFTHSSGGGNNCIEIVNAANSGTPVIRAFGSSDSNVPLRLTAKGSSSVITTATSFRVEGLTVSGVTEPGIIEARGGNQLYGGGKIYLYERSTNGNNYVGFEAPDALASDLFWTLPATDGTADQALVTDGGAGLYWKSFEVPLTFSTGLTRTTNTITVNTTQNIIRLSNLTTNGFIKATNADGTLSIDTNTYLTGNQTITLSGDVTGSGATSIATTIANDAVTFAKVQNITSGVILGRTTASTGDIEEVTPGSGVLAWLQDATSAKLATAITDETGSGSLVFATSPTLVTPRVNLIHTATSPNSPVLGFNQVAGSVNYLQVSNASTVNGPIIEPIGSDSNIGVIIKSKNVESIRLQSDSGLIVEPVASTAGLYGAIEVRGGTAAGDGGVIAVRNPGNSGYVGFLAPDTITASVLYTLPSSDGTSGQVLRTNGSGVLSWIDQSAAVSDGDKVDILVSGSGTSWVIKNDVVTFAKMQNISPNRLLGRTGTTTGDIQEITASSPLLLQTGTLTFSDQNANRVFAGPVSSSGPPTFRLLNINDIPDLSSLYLTVNTYIPPGEQYFGTVTSIGMTVPSFLSVSPSTITSSGTFAISLVNQNANLVFASPNGSTGVPTFRKIATNDLNDDAVTYAKMQNMAADRVLGRRSTTGDPEELTLTQTLDLDGTAAQGDILYRGASTWTRLGAGTSGRVLQTKGTGANPEWAPAREVLTAARTYFVGFSLGSVTANATTDKIEKTAHGLENGDPVVFNAATAPTGITLGTVYYVRNKTANDFEIYTAATGGTQVTWTTSGSTVTCHTGNDNNSGIGTNGRSVALLTIQKAIDLAAEIDTATFNVTIQLCNGIHLLLATLIPKNVVGSGRIIILGDAASYTNVIVTLGSGGVLGLWNQESVRTIYELRGLNFQTNQAGMQCLRVIGGTTLEVGRCRFAAGSQSFTFLVGSATGAFVLFRDDCDFTSLGSQGLTAVDLGVLRFFKVDGSITLTLTNAPTNPGVNLFTFSTARLGYMRFDSVTVDGALAGNAAITRDAKTNGGIFNLGFSRTNSGGGGITDTSSLGGFIV